MRPTLSDEAKLSWAEVDARCTDGAAMRRYIKEVLPREAWEDSKLDEETEHNSVDVDDETLQRVVDEVTHYVPGTSAVS